ncbi:MAG: outer membrane lipoprotein carrier protein LolA [Nitrospirota bacterium]
MNIRNHKVISCHYLFTIIIIGLSLCCGISPVHAGNSLEEVVNRLEKRYDEIKDIRADFVQKTTIEGFEKEIVSNGILYIKKPERMRWDYRKEVKQQIYINDDVLWLYQPEQGQAIKSRLNARVESLIPFYLLTDIKRLREEFDIEFEEKKAEKKRGVYRLRLHPKDQQMIVSKVIIEIADEDFFIHKISIFEKSGNSSFFDFTMIRYNTGLNDEIFLFKIPEGIEVIEQPFIE